MSSTEEARIEETSTWVKTIGLTPQCGTEIEAKPVDVEGIYPIAQ